MGKLRKGVKEKERRREQEGRREVSGEIERGSKER